MSVNTLLERAKNVEWKRALGLHEPPAKDAIDKNLLRWTHLLENSFTIPGTSMRIGLDGLIGLVPGLGDVVTLAIGYFMLQEAKRLGVPKEQRAVMVANYAIDLVGGLLPVIGDLFDFAFKANTRNLDLIRRHLEKARASEQRRVPL